VADKSLAKAFRRKMGLDETVLRGISTVNVESSLLMNPSRRTIFEFICNHPCMHLRAISRGTDFSTQNVRWHLNKLKEGGLVTERSVGKKKHYSPLKNMFNEEECRILGLLNHEEVKRVYLEIQKNPKTTQMDLSKTLDIYQQKLSNLLLSLERSELIDYEKKGREKAYQVTSLIKILEDKFETRAENYKKELVLALEKDGLNPKIKSEKKGLLSIELHIGSEERYILKIRMNPVKAVLRG
jgi:DNA-binding transcriptional ArsR family regulator